MGKAMSGYHGNNNLVEIIMYNVCVKVTTNTSQLTVAAYWRNRYIYSKIFLV